MFAAAFLLLAVPGLAACSHTSQKPAAAAAALPPAQASVDTATSGVAAGTSPATSSAAASSPNVAASSPSGQPAPLIHPVVPQSIAIPVNNPAEAPVRPGRSYWGTDIHSGEQGVVFPVPPDLYSVTWWEGGPGTHADFVPAPQPGSAGLAEFTLHAGIDGAYGVGNNLGKLREGQQITVSGKDAQGKETQLVFAVIGTPVSSIPKEHAANLQYVLTHPPADARLVLVTCSGSVNEALSSSNFNTAVYAGLVAIR